MPSGERPPLGAIKDTLMNNISSMLPPVPLLTQTFPIPANMICHGECDRPLCTCINILEVELDACVELVLSTSKIFYKIYDKERDNNNQFTSR